LAHRFGANAAPALILWNYDLANLDDAIALADRGGEVLQ
jgi:hypothetical protein